MSNLKKTLNILLSVIFASLIIVNIVLYAFNMGDSEPTKFINNLTIIIGLVSLVLIVVEVVYYSLSKPKGKANTINIVLFAGFILISLGTLFKALFFILDIILPDTYTKVITDFSDLFYQGIKNTLVISLVGTVVGFFIACILGTLRTITVNKSDKLVVKIIKKVTNFVIRLYVTVFRGTPMMVQAMIIFYGFVGIFHWSPVVAGLFIVSINTGAYLTEVVREGILSVDSGQMEAARSLGFSYSKSLLLIIFPQAIKNSMAAIGNEFVINIKDTSVLNVIGCAEMYYILNMSAGTNYRYMEQMLVGALIYLMLTFTTTKVLEFLEKKLDAPSMELRGSN